MTRRDNINGILCLCAGIAIFSVQDLILKLLSGEYPLHQAMVLRSISAVPLPSCRAPRSISVLCAMSVL